MNSSSESPSCCAGERNKLDWECSYWIADVLFQILHAVLEAEKLEWGNSDQINRILQKYPGGFDLILGADIYILITANYFFCQAIYIQG